MVPRVNTLEVLTKTAAVTGIAFLWVNFTVVSLKMAWHIISTSPGDETWKPIVKQRVMCESCHGYFLDDGGELIHGKLLCEYCSDELELKKINFLYIPTMSDKAFQTILNGALFGIAVFVSTRVLEIALYQKKRDQENAFTA